MNLPRRRTRPKMGLRQSSVVRCPAHTAWVRKRYDCAVKDATATEHYPCWGRIETHHVKTRGAGGGDEQVVPLCQGHHALLDSPAWSSTRFERDFKINMKDLADTLWSFSPHGFKYRRERMASPDRSKP